MTSKTFLGGNLEGDFIFFDWGVDVNGMVAGLFVSFVPNSQHLVTTPVLSRKRSPKWSSEKGRVFFFTTRLDVET